MEKLIDKILEIHRLSCEIDEQVTTCGMGEGYTPRWHIYGFENFKRVADALNNGEFKTIDWSDDEDSYRYCYEFEHRGVRVFTLGDEEQI